ncbi:hypothetical protein ACOSQ3_020730 [Xanthoceras sorbifolium]
MSPSIPCEVGKLHMGKWTMPSNYAAFLDGLLWVNPRPDEKNEGGIIVEIKLKELYQKLAEVNIEWSLVPGRGGRPTFASLQPGGTVSFEHRNLKGLTRSIMGSMTTSNFLNPRDDLAFKLVCNHIWMVYIILVIVH